MKKLLVVAVGVGALVACISAAAFAEWVIIDQHSYRFDMKPLGTRQMGLYLEKGLEYDFYLHVERAYWDPIGVHRVVPIKLQLVYPAARTGDPVLRNVVGLGSVSFSYRPSTSGNYVVFGACASGCIATLVVNTSEWES